MIYECRIQEDFFRTLFLFTLEKSFRILFYVYVHCKTFQKLFMCTLETSFRIFFSVSTGRFIQILFMYTRRIFSELWLCVNPRIFRILLMCTVYTILEDFFRNFLCVHWKNLSETCLICTLEDFSKNFKCTLAA